MLFRSRTRSIAIEVPERENTVFLEHTLLGIELKVGRRRFSAPDLSTARYMRVFARVGCRSFACPYDITLIPLIADVMETAWQRTLLTLHDRLDDRTAASRAQMRSKVIRAIRLEINEIGPGDVMPAFDRPTRQRG